MTSLEELKDSAEEKMMNAIEALEKDFGRLRTGKASTSLVDNILVDYYGTTTRLRDMASISTPESRLIVIQPWDQNAVPEIEKALQASELGISPISDGKLIRLPIPDLTEERRKELSKQAKKRAELAKVEVRNARRDANDEAKKAQKASEITEDDLKDALDGIQKLTDEYTSNIDTIAENKENDIMQI